MYYLVFTISLAMAAPRVSRNCYTLCDLQKSHPTNAVPRGCNCSLSDLMNAESTSTEITLLDDAGVYFIPADGDLFQAYFTPEPFLISNPVKYNPRTKKGSEAKKDYSEESIELIDTHERRKTLIRVSNNLESQPPTYLDLEIQDLASSETSVIQQGNFIPTFESAEQALVECLDLHILDFTRKYGSVENFNEFWEARNLQIYEDLSNSDLNDKIKKYCSETEFLIEQSLQDIKRGVPKKKTNFRYVNEDEDDISIKNEMKESAESEKHNIDMIDKKHESSLERSSSLQLSHTTHPTVDNIKELKSFNINSNKDKSTFTEFTTVTTKNTSTAYDTEFDMDTMPSDIILKTFKEINKPDFYLVKNKTILEDTKSFSFSTTQLSDELTVGDTIGTTKNWSEEQEERTVPIPFGINLKINYEINKTKNEMTNEISTTNINESTLDDTTIIPALTSPLSEEQYLGDIGGNTERSVAETEESTNESIEFDFDTMPSKVMLKPNLYSTKSSVIMVRDKSILDNLTFPPASTTPKYEAVALGDISSISETYTPNKHGGGKYEEKKLDLDTMPSGIILKQSKEILKRYLNIAGNDPKLDELISFRTASTSQQNKKISLLDPSGNIAISMGTMPSEVNIKTNNELNMSIVNMASDELISDNITLIPESTTPQNEELSVEHKSRNLKTPSAEIKTDGNDEGMKLDLVTISSEIIVKPSSDSFKLQQNVVASDVPIVDEVIHFPTAFTSPQNEKVSVENSNNSTERSITRQQEKRTDGDLDLNTMASKVILNSASSGVISDETPKFNETFINIHEDTISNISSDEDTTTVTYISTTPVTIQPQRQIFKESEVKIPKIITKECQNNEVQSIITGNEALPNNDFELTDVKTKSLHKKIKQDDDYGELEPNSSIEVVDTTDFNNSYISGNLYFGSKQELVPVRLLQTDSGKVSLGIDGQSLCEKLLQRPNSKSLLLSTLCDCVHKMPKNKSTNVSQ